MGQHGGIFCGVTVLLYFLFFNPEDIFSIDLLIFREGGREGKRERR